MRTARRLGLLGGTLDPMHYGHLDAAEAAREAVDLDEILILPTHHPAHRSRDPRASAFHRFALAALAIADRPGMRLSDVELRRTGPSYTIDTLRTLHEQGWTPTQLFFILGADAFAEISTWHEYPAVLDAAHFLVIARPGTPTRSAVSQQPGLSARICEPTALNAATHSTRVILVEAATRDISSTTIRERLRQHQAIDDLVPPAVGRHITTHQLYGAVDDLHGESTVSIN